MARNPDLYTREDFLREHPPRKDAPVLLASLVEQIDEMVNKERFKGRLEMQRETILRILTHRFRADFDTDGQIEEQIAKEMGKVESGSALDALLDVALTASDLSLFRQEVTRCAPLDE